MIGSLQKITLLKILITTLLFTVRKRTQVVPSEKSSIAFKMNNSSSCPYGQKTHARMVKILIQPCGI
jgi:hypothetical protein